MFDDSWSFTLVMLTQVQSSMGILHFVVVTRIFRLGFDSGAGDVTDMWGSCVGQAYALQPRPRPVALTEAYGVSLMCLA